MDTLCTRLTTFAIVACFTACCVYGQTCSRQTIQDCQEPFGQKFKSGDDKAFPVRDQNETNQLCDAYDDYVKCLDPFRDNCTEGYKSTFEGTENSFKYVCKQGGKEVYLAGVDCFSKPDVQEEGGKCHDDGSAKINQIDKQLKAATDDGSRDKLKTEYCETVQDKLLDCVYDVLKSYCDEAIAMYEYTKDRAQWTPTVEYLGCDAPPSKPNSSPPLLVGSLAVCIAVLLSTLTLLL